MTAAAIARKITVSVWHLLMGPFTPLLEVTDYLHTKRLDTLLGKDAINSLGFANREAV